MGDKRRCGAKLRRKPGRTCQSTALFPNSRCRIHGGKSLAGVASGTFRHGRHSIHFPAAWGRLGDLLADPDLRSITLDLVVLDRRMGDILARVGTLKADSAKARAIEENADLAERRSRLLDAEDRRLGRWKSSIPEAQARVLFRALSIAVREEAVAADGTTFDARAFLALLSQRFDRLMGRSRLKVSQAQAESATASSTDLRVPLDADPFGATAIESPSGLVASRTRRRPT
jgi:hypothetical protein